MRIIPDEDGIQTVEHFTILNSNKTLIPIQIGKKGWLDKIKEVFINEK